VAPIVEYVESDFSLLDKNIYGLDSFYVYQPSGEVSIQAESAAAAAEAALQDPIIAAVVTPPNQGGDGEIGTPWEVNPDEFSPSPYSPSPSSQYNQTPW